MESLARKLEFEIMSEGCKNPDKRVLYAVAAVRELIDNFPDEEVDEVLYEELRKRFDTNGERIIAVGNVIGKNMFYFKDRFTQINEWYNKLVVL
jgi:hypothetical protein